MDDIFIVGAQRSAIGSLEGALSPLSAAEIGAQVIAGVIDDAKVDPGAIDEVIIGQVLQGGAGQNPARQAAIQAGIPVKVPAMTINKVCGAGQKSIHLAAQAIKAGDAGLVLAGGQDSMSRAPHIIPKARQGQKMGDTAVKDMMILDGLWDAFHDMHMGNTVETLARRYQITREDQDHFALHSQEKARAAQEANVFADEIVAVTVPGRKGDTVFDRDEHPRLSSFEKLSSMRPAFEEDGTITAGNASGINDGASAVLVASGRRVRELDLTPMARIAAYASFAMEPMNMGLGPVGASQQALAKAGWTVDDLDIVEVNEAFAAQSLAVQKEMGWDPDKCNPNGGAIALGHPLAASGNRIVVTLVHELRRLGLNGRKGKGLATLCIGGGMGVAICVEAV
ncbi:acetyl-CoA C-acetyltransferase [Pseudohoeflea suaedae]|uniref:Beta-ketothiolase n=1 Tax=Pseudohoeflea suaedae TaxID=877384 RepID=A0A4R5PI97_9HYPH|nr:acetyl-CoA C-acetyltransferase [Pseudohoeflea suaedae]TDH34953.1 acetyl-CoA C-acetyltransferase [Pseudohoeflea suaedae]